MELPGTTKLRSPYADRKDETSSTLDSLFDFGGISGSYPRFETLARRLGNKATAVGDALSPGALARQASRRSAKLVPATETGRTWRNAQASPCAGPLGTPDRNFTLSRVLLPPGQSLLRKDLRANAREKSQG